MSVLSAEMLPVMVNHKLKNSYLIRRKTLLMSLFDKLLDGIEKMDAYSISMLINKDRCNNLYNGRETYELLHKAFEYLQALGNKKLIFKSECFKVFDDNVNQSILNLNHAPKVLHCKFLGDKTMQHISLLFSIYNDDLINISDWIDVTQTKGSIHIDEHQVLVYHMN